MTRKENGNKNKIPILLSTFMSMTLLSTNLVHAETDSLVGTEIDTVTKETEDIELNLLNNISSDGGLAEENEEEFKTKDEVILRNIEEKTTEERVTTENIVASEEEKNEGNQEQGERALIMTSALPSSDEIYESIINAKYAYKAWGDAQLLKELYPNDSRLQTALDTAAGYILNQGIKSHQHKDYLKAVETYEKILSEDLVSNSIYNPTSIYHTQAKNQQELLTADDLYKSVINAQFAYEAWDNAQLLKELYPNDSRLQTALDTAAGYILNQGVKSHRNKDYSKAVATYEKILSDALVSDTIYNPTSIYHTQAENQQELLTEDDLYDSVINAQFAYKAWDDAQLLKELYPNDVRVQEALNVASEYNLRQGILSYEREDYETAVRVFDKIINENLVNSNTSQTAKKYKDNSIEHIHIQQANNLYNSIINAQYAYEAWDDAQLLKELFPQDARLPEAINVAAGYNLNQGIKSHQNSDFLKADEIYTKILSEDLLASNIYNMAKILSSQAAESKRLKTADELYNAIINAEFAYEAWDDAQLLKVIYSQDTRLQKALDTAARYIFNQGIKIHESENYFRAAEIYEKILSDQSINKKILHLTKSYRKLAINNKKLVRADDLYDSIIHAKFAYQAWDDAQLLKEIFPHDKRLQVAIDVAAGYNLRQGVKSHRANDFEKANEVYTKLLSESLLSPNVFETTNVLSSLAGKSMKLFTADELYHSVLNAKYAYEAWDDAQMFKLLYPDDIRLQNTLDVAAGYNLRQAINSHQNNNFKKANELYSKLLAENLLSPSLTNTISLLASQASKSVRLTTANRLYNSIVNAKYAYQAWDDAQYFKWAYSNDSRVKDAINIAADYQLNQAINNHRKSNFKSAASIYERLINEELIRSNTRKTLQVFNKLANNNKRLLSKNEYYNKINASSTLTSFETAVEGNKVYSGDIKMSSLLNEAANNYLSAGRKHQRNNQDSRADTIYSKIINEESVSQSIRTLAEVFNNQLSKQHVPIVYLDPGHGAHDPGAVHGGVEEKKLNLITSNYLKSALEAKGYTVILSRNTDVFVGLTERAVEANRLKADIFVSVHYNSMGGSGIATGIETFIHHTVPGGFGQETRKSKFKTDNPRINESLYLADDIHNELIRKTGMYNRGVKGNNFNVLRNTQVPAVLLELGFMDNAAERARISTHSYQRTAANAIADGIEKYFRSIDK